MSNERIANATLEERNLEKDDGPTNFQSRKGHDGQILFSGEEKNSATFRLAKKHERPRK
jgi:hypothetical protein